MAKPKRRKHRKLDRSLPEMRPNAGGIDVGATEIFVAVPADRDKDSVRSFPTFTQDLHELTDWLKQCRVDTVAMESTGVYWIPLFQILEARGIEVHLVNAQHVHHVPGRKSDVLDCQWLQYLHSVGLLKASFRPEQAVCEIRSLMRHRENLVEMSCVHVQHMHKSLDQMNLQIHHVISDITGVTGLAIADAIVAGNTDPKELAKLRDHRIKASVETVTKSLVGDYRAEHIFTLKQSLTAYRHYQQLIADCDQEVQQRIQAFDSKNAGPSAPADASPSAAADPPRFDLHSHLARIFGVDLTLIPGFECLRIQTLLSELGADLSKFPTPDTFCSWLNLCSKDGSSAGRRIRAPKVKTKNRATQAFRFAAQSLHNNQSYLGDYYRSQRARHGAPKAIKNTAHKLARIFYHLVTTRQPYDETVFAKLEMRKQQQRFRKLQSLANRMGYSLVEVHA
jgi:Transposase IS116/IS110/IS902 family./Transposase.